MFLPILWSLGLGTYIVWKFGRSLSALHPSPLSSVAGPPKDHWFTGNLLRLMRDGLDYNLALFRRFGGIIKVYGMLGTEQLLVYDPVALQHILVKDQDSFEETDMFVETNKLLFGEGLISTLGKQHRRQRKMLNPVFSLSNLRSIFPRLQPIADGVLALLKNELPVNGGSTEIDLLPWLRRGTIEYVARGILGVRFDCLEPAEANEYVGALCNVQHIALKVLFLRPFVPWAVRTLSVGWRNKLVDWLPFSALRELRDIAHVMHRSASHILHTKRVEAANGIHINGGPDAGTDLMNIMLRANAVTEENARLTDDELVGQINTFILGGQETTTSALARMLHILALEQGAQTRLRKEVREAKMVQASARGLARPEEVWQSISLPYDVLAKLPYLDAIVRETLRLYPPTSMINRVATRDTVIPLNNAVRSSYGEATSSINVPAGTNIIISILGANRDPCLWGADASEWRPERWLTATDAHMGDTSKTLGLDLDFGDESAIPVVVGLHGLSGSGVRPRNPGVYGSMMTFLGGNRACIGFKFAEMEVKQILSTLVSTMHFALPSTTDEHGTCKEIYWRMDGLQVPVVRPPHGDFKTSQVPLDVRLVVEADFLQTL
ncbi:cytochrome P450 [Trametes meyenii]|nr:cytochrome P450 [Trametes meyenii]